MSLGATRLPGSSAALNHCGVGFVLGHQSLLLPIFWLALPRTCIYVQGPRARGTVPTCVYACLTQWKVLKEGFLLFVCFWCVFLRLKRRCEFLIPAVLSKNCFVSTKTFFFWGGGGGMGGDGWCFVCLLVLFVCMFVLGVGCLFLFVCFCFVFCFVSFGGGFVCLLGGLFVCFCFVVVAAAAAAAAVVVFDVVRGGWVP